MVRTRPPDAFDLSVSGPCQGRLGPTEQTVLALQMQQHYDAQLEVQKLEASAGLAQKWKVPPPPHTRRGGL